MRSSLLATALAAFTTEAFSPAHIRSVMSHTKLKLASNGGSIDVSDLGLTMEDLNAPLPNEMFAITSSGRESTSRIPSVNDDGCIWEEGVDTMDVTLSIPGLRGQPPAALSLDTTKNTVTITAFGMAVWSCILRGNCDPKSASFSATDGYDMTPLIKISMKKLEKNTRWGGFIAQVGEDSIL